MGSGKDNDLLARLNALKPSSITFGDSHAAPAVDVEVSKPLTVEDKLAERLKALRSSGSQNIISSFRPGGAVTSSPPSAPTARLDRTEKADALTSQVRDEVDAEGRDPIRDWQHDEGDERTLEDLLEELGPEDQWRLDPEEPRHVDALLKEARAALPEDEVGSAGDLEGKGESKLNERPVEEDADGTADGSNVGSKTEEAEADDYVKSVLAEIDIERKYGARDEEGNEEEATESQEPQSMSTLDLPSTPQNLLPIKPTSEPEQSQEDTDLEARFSKLGLDLPSTPTNKPSSKAKTSKASSKLPTYTDDDIESWCCICNEDGEVKCLGCDNDIYCQSCWQEGHGNGPGQESGHRAVQYTRKGGGMAATS